MGDSLATLRTRFLDEIEDPGQTVATSTNARITRLLNEGCRHAAHIIQKRDPRFPGAEWKIPVVSGVPRYSMPEDFAEDCGVYRSDLTGEPRLNKISVAEWNRYRYTRHYLMTGPVNDIGGQGLVADIVPATIEVYYIDGRDLGILPIPTDAVRRFVLKYRSSLIDLSNDLDMTPIPAGQGTDVICLYSAASFLSRRGHDISAIAARLKAAEERLAANFGATSASPPVMVEASPMREASSY